MNSSGACLLRKFGVPGVWAVFVGAFAVIGIRGLLPNAFPGILRVTSEFVSTDSQLLWALEIPNASQRIAAALGNVRGKRPMLYIGSESPASLMTFFSLQAISWPRPVEFVPCDEHGRLKLPDELPPAIFFYDMSAPSGWKAGERIGKMTLFRMNKSR